MSTHGRSGVTRLIFGSVAEHVLAGALVPVVLIPGCSQVAWSQTGTRVVLPLDGSDVSEAAIEPAISFADRLGAPILLLGVV